MKGAVSRRDFIKITFGAAVVVALLPRIALAAAKNNLRAVRTGIQPGNKTRIVIETDKKPSYSLKYPDKQLKITLNDAVGKAKPELAKNSLVSAIAASEAGGAIVLSINLKNAISEIPKKNIMILEPGGSNKNYRLVLDLESSKSDKSDAARSATATTSTTQSSPKKGNKFRIVIDAGHGGKDPGCIGQAGTREKDVVLTMAKKLRDNLKGKYDVVLTRDKDYFLNLDTRSGIAVSKNADLFISLHANANPSKKMQGFSVYYLSKNASDAEAAKMADAENAADLIAVDGFKRFEADVRNTLSSLQQQAVQEYSAKFGNGVVSATKQCGIKQQDRPLRYAPFAVLKSSIPSALVELGHLSNKEEEKLLTSGSHQDKLVSALRRAIDDFEFLA
ncbi:MAG: N-acetylmuramoyl-L-alanine amidase [Rickettsiales bacterium]|jgi:N-acetylmuramoyl-L-alanine amidase|nr:N-acetylmuramoyl-L-alanine amidase [Rickettsiales bacterium]